MVMIWYICSLVNTNGQEMVELEMTGLANSSDVTVSEKSFSDATNLLYNKSVLSDLIFSNTIISRRLRKQLRLSFLARPTQPSWLRWKQMCTLLRFVTFQIRSYHMKTEEASSNTVITCIPVYSPLCFQVEMGSEMKKEVKETNWGEFLTLNHQIKPRVPSSLFPQNSECYLLFISISVFAGPSFTWKHHWAVTSPRWKEFSVNDLICMICKSLNDNNVFMSFVFYSE